MKKAFISPGIFSLVILAAINAITSWYFSAEIRLESIEKLTSALQNTSAMIFAISGIWVAYLYPNAISGLVTEEFDQSLKEKSNKALSRLRLIVGVIVLSGTVMAGVILLIIFASLLEGTNFYSDNQDFFKGVGLFAVLFFCEIQLFCIYVVLASSISFIIELGNLIGKKNAEKKFHVTRLEKDQ
jgi:uncharacterized membrane protein